MADVDAATDANSTPVIYEDLAALEQDFDNVDTEIMRTQYKLSQPLFRKRTALVSKIPNFWPLVFEQAPAEISEYIQPSDSEVFAKCLIGLDVRRPELDEQTLHAEPRSLSITFHFAENQWFTNRTLEKRFYYRRAEDGWTGLVSEPVRIAWKPGKDLTRGLTDAARSLWDARVASDDRRKRNLPEFDALAKLVGKHNVTNTSFFAWFAHISSRRYVGADESAEATRVESARRAEYANGKRDQEQERESPDEDQLEQQVEVDENGEDLATAIADDLWPAAIKYFISAQEEDDLVDDDLDSHSDSDPESDLEHDSGAEDESIDAKKPDITGILKQKHKPDARDNDQDRAPKRRKRGLGSTSQSAR